VIYEIHNESPVDFLCISNIYAKRPSIVWEDAYTYAKDTCSTSGTIQDYNYAKETISTSGEA
jgi:hypothetical protein